MTYKKEAKLCPRNPSCSAVHIRLSFPLKNSSHSETVNMGSFSKLVGVYVRTASLTIQALHVDIEWNDDRNGGTNILAPLDI